MLDGRIARSYQFGDMHGTQNGLTVFYIHMESTGAANGRNDHSRLPLITITLRANQLDAIRVRFNILH